MVWFILLSAKAKFKGGCLAVLLSLLCTCTFLVVYPDVKVCFCGHAELSIRREFCRRWMNIIDPHSTLCQPAVVSSELINHRHFILFLFRIGCHVKLSVTYVRTSSVVTAHRMEIRWAITTELASSVCVACIIIQHYFNPTRENNNNNSNNSKNNKNNNMIFV
jgi:hypothetical protein